MILKIKKWWWKRKGYKPFVPMKFSNWKVGMGGSTGLGKFEVRGIEPPETIWVEWKNADR